MGIQNGISGGMLSARIIPVTTAEQSYTVTGFFIENYGWGVATIPLAVASVLGAIAFFFVKTHDHDSDKATARAAEIDSDLTQAAV